MGIAKIQIITGKEAHLLIQAMKEAGYGITHHEAKGGSEEVSIIYSIVKRTEIPKVEEIIRRHNPKAFYSIEDVKFVSQGIFPIRPESMRWRKGK